MVLTLYAEKETEQEHAFAYLIILETLTKVAVQNAFIIVIVRQTEHVLIKNAQIPVQVHVVKMPNVTLLIIFLHVYVNPVILVIRLDFVIYHQKKLKKLRHPKILASQILVAPTANAVNQIDKLYAHVYLPILVPLQVVVQNVL